MARTKQEQPETIVCEDKDGVWIAKVSQLQEAQPFKRSPEKREGLRPSMTPEGREKQLVELAVRLAEKQLVDGTASSAVIVHYLKIASTREVLEREILEKQSRLLAAKTSNMDKDRESEDLAKAAIAAMKSYHRG
jgi:hypothetical protein